MLFAGTYKTFIILLYLNFIICNGILDLFFDIPIQYLYVRLGFYFNFLWHLQKDVIKELFQ